MVSKMFRLLLLCLWLFLGDKFVAVSRELADEEDRELENQLKLLNKPSITTIWTRYGEQYDCVDFYKQPAFDHPALKNHNFHPQMRPSLNVTRTLHKHLSRTRESSSFNHIWLKGKGCPSGSVPIKRVTKDDLIKIKLAEKIYGQTYELNTPQEHGTHYAVLRTSSGMQLYGAGMHSTVYNPIAKGSQYSSSHVKISNGVDSIETGWTVNPSLYKDGQSRLFIHTNAGAARCFNTYCPGFVIVNQDVPMGAQLTSVSRSGGTLHTVSFDIYKDPRGWWLQWGSLNETVVGFWPDTIFTSLKKFATYVELGGKAYSPPNVPSPPMRAGIGLTYDPDYDAYCSQITVLDKSYNIVIVPKMNPYADIKQYEAINGGTYPDRGHVMLFGGPGGYTGN